MSGLDYGMAGEFLRDCFQEAAGRLPEPAQELLQTRHTAFEAVFRSKTQSYREVLLGCAVARYLDPAVNIRHPYIKQGADAFNGRSLDEETINPFLRTKQIPCSRGPYLATFRRNVRLDASARDGLRDQAGYDAMLAIMEAIETPRGHTVKDVVLCLLHEFIKLRDQADIRLVSVEKLSIEQTRYFLDTFLHNPSGGMIPMLVSRALFEAVNEFYRCGWSIDCQGVNSADGATGTPGDLTIRRGEEIVKAIEVTERPIGVTRVETTFHTKIATNAVRDYLFIYTSAVPDEGVYDVAKIYFAQGYDVNFIKLTNLAAAVFAAGDASMRRMFMDRMLGLLRQGDVPAAVKTAWNDALQAVLRA